MSRFTDEAANPVTIGALMAGGLAYRVGRIGVMGLGSSSLLRPLSVVAGLGSEVSAYEFTSRSLLSLSCNSSNPHLWRWEGQGGIGKGFLSSGITFGILKGAGSLAREQNLFFQHAFQSIAIVAGHHSVSLLGITPAQEGGLAEQLLHAEVTNLQLAAGSNLARSMAPGVLALERGLDGSLSVRNLGNLFQDPLGPRSQGFVMIMEGKVRGIQSSEKNPWILTMSSNEGKDENDGLALAGSSGPEASEFTSGKEQPSPIEAVFLQMKERPQGPAKETIPPEEVKALEKLPLAPWVPGNPDSNKSFYGHLEISSKMSLREAYQRLEEVLQDPWLLSRAFCGMARNNYMTVSINLQFMKEDFPEENLGDLLLRKRNDLPSLDPESVGDLLRALDSFSEILNILTQSEDGKTLRAIYIGRPLDLYRGFSGTYKDFLKDILPMMPAELRRQYGWDSLPNHEDMIRKIYRLTHPSSKPSEREG